MKLILVRHGQTGYNATKIVQGHLQNPLSEIGLEQAKMVGKRLKDEHYDVILCSDLRRTKETLEGIIKYHPHNEVIYDPLLRERSSGVFEGGPSAEREDARLKAGLSKEDFRPEGGENDEDFLLRIHTFIENTYKSFPDKTILVVTHWRWIMKFLVNLDPSLKEKLVKDEDINNTSVNIVDFVEKGQHRIIKINSTEHLEDSFTDIAK